MNTYDLTKKVERFPELEQRYGIKLEGVFAQVARDDVSSSLDATMTVNGEVRALQAAGLPATIRLFASAHNSDGQVLGVWTTEVAREGFAICQAFSMHEYCNALPRVEIAKIKLYPQGL